MSKSPVINELTDWTSIHPLTKYICLILLLFAVVAYPYQTLAADVTSKQPKQTGGNETITGAFGIKLGEDIKPYTARIDSSFGINLLNIKYRILKPPVNLNVNFPNAYYLELRGIPDDNDRIIILRFSGMVHVNSCNTNTIKAIYELLQEKYKKTKSENKYVEVSETYVDTEGNDIKMFCNQGSFHVTYTSHLMSDFIKRVEVAKQKQKEDAKKALDKGI